MFSYYRNIGGEVLEELSWCKDMKLGYKFVFDLCRIFHN